MANTTLTVLDVGHGNSAVLVDGDRTVVFDTGPGSTLLEYLQEQDISKVNAVLLSHSDRDHIEGLVALLASHTVEICCVRLNTDALKRTKLWGDLLWILERERRESKIDFSRKLTVSNTGDFDTESVQIEILAPSTYLADKGPGGQDRKGRTLSTHALSAVIRLTKGKEPRVLLAGDIDAVGLEKLIESRPSAEAPVAVYPHHGGHAGKKGKTEAFARDFCKLVSPDVIIFSTGRRRTPANPHPDTVKAVRDTLPDAHLYCTQLSPECASAVPDSDAPHLNERFARGKEERECCAGTITMTFEKDRILLTPSMEDHRGFVEQAIPSALCKRPID